MSELGKLIKLETVFSGKTPEYGEDGGANVRYTTRAFASLCAKAAKLTIVEVSPPVCLRLDSH